jgi:Kef-type K+ transport system membrane component KefB
MGTAMSVTAFPVLARILRERNLQRTPLGSLATACAAFGDVSAWCMLAAVVVIVRAAESSMPLGVTVGGTLLFGAFMFLVARRRLAWLATARTRAGGLSQDLLTLVLLVTLVSAVGTELLGIHAIFGAFIAGAVMPRDSGFVRELTEKLEDVTVVLLVPLYFAFTGLRTSVALLGSEINLWAICALVTLVAVLGKWGGATLAAWWTGLPFRESSALGVLLNTRGLVELVVLNVGLDIGVLSPTLFAMLVLMALVTTFMTSPLLAWVYPTNWEKQPEQKAVRIAQAIE